MDDDHLYVVAWAAIGLRTVVAASPEEARRLAQEIVVVDLTKAGIKANVTTAQPVL